MGRRAGALAEDYALFARDVDINRFVTGTLDSLCEEALSGTRAPNERPPVVVEAFAANQMLARRGEIYRTSRQIGQPFLDYLALYTTTGDPPSTLGDMTRVVRTLVDRFIQDNVDLAAYVAAGPHQAARQSIAEIYRRYSDHLRETNQMDFPRLERVFFERLQTDRLPDLIAGLGVLLVDEYQDTNPLQEQIYFDLARRTGAQSNYFVISVPAQRRR
jgi:DNA helicase-2/ATP-dependent DNA helicase PcrA